MAQYTSRGFAAASRSNPTPSRSITPGRNDSTITSAPAARRTNASRPADDFRSQTTERRLRVHTLYPWYDRKGSPPGGSTLITSAPCSAISSTPRGPAHPQLRSRIRTSSSAWAMHGHRCTRSLPRSMDEPTLTVTELNRAARRALQDAFAGPVWVRGEVQRLVRSKPGHVYFDLVDKDELRDRVRSKVRVALFRDDREAVERKLRDAGLELSDDVEIRIAGRVGFYVERGEFQLVMHSVDQSFTVGRLAAERGRLRDRSGRVRRGAPRRLGVIERDVERVEARLRALDPRRVLERGYT